MKARDLLPILQEHPDADIWIQLLDYDVIGGKDSIQSVEYAQLTDTDGVILVRVQ